MESHIVMAAETLGYLGILPITNTLLVSWMVTIFLVTFAYLATRRVQTIPSGIQNVAEAIIEPIYGLVEGLACKKATVIFPIITTFFLFILTANWFGLLPGFGSIGFSGEDHGKQVFVPLLRSVNSDLNVTLALALVSVIFTHILAIKYLGVKSYMQKWVSLNPLFLFVGVLELISEGTKTLSLSLRLFGNIFAGEVVLATISSLLAFIVPLPFYFLEIIVGIVQAAVFMILTLVFIVLMTEKHEAH